MEVYKRVSADYFIFTKEKVRFQNLRNPSCTSKKNKIKVRDLGVFGFCFQTTIFSF